MLAPMFCMSARRMFSLWKGVDLTRSSAQDEAFAFSSLKVLVGGEVCKRPLFCCTWMLAWLPSGMRCEHATLRGLESSVLGVWLGVCWCLGA